MEGRRNSGRRGGRGRWLGRLMRRNKYRRMRWGRMCRLGDEGSSLLVMSCNFALKLKEGCHVD